MFSLARPSRVCKRKRPSNGVDCISNLPSNGVDRISNLPNSVLCYILSLLPTADAVATSLLSKRWKFLWTNINKLKFDDCFGLFQDGKNREIKFTHFVNKVLIFLNQQSIDKFSLSILEYCKLYDVTTWLAIAVARKLKELEFYVATRWPDPRTQLPSSIFTCKTLEVLVLEGNMNLNVPSLVCLPNLKKLHIGSVIYKCDVSVCNLITGCSSLDTLIIGRAQYDNVVTFSISSPTLRKLIFTFYGDHPFPQKYCYKLEINAPELRYLYLHDDLLEDLSVENFCLLDEADVELRYLYSKDVVKFLRGVCNVKHLRLHPSIAEALSLADLFPSFPRLIHLEAECCDWCLLLDLVKGMNKLEFLDLSKMQTSESWNKPEKVPICFLSCLQKVSITGFGGGEDELTIVAYILKNAKVLRTMILQTEYGLGLEAKYQLLQKVSKLSRGSEGCEITFA